MECDPLKRASAERVECVAVLQAREQLTAQEPRRPLLEEGGDALAEVLGLDRDRLELGLELELLLERRRLRVVEQPLRQPDRASRHRRELRSPRAQRLRLDDLS